MAGTLRQAWNLSVWQRVAEIVANPPETTPVSSSSRARRQRQVRLPPAKISALLEDYATGMSGAQLGKKYGIDHSTAIRHVRVNGQSVRPNKVGIPKLELQNAIALRDAGWTYTAIGKKYGCSHSAVRKMLLKHRT